MDGKGVVCKKRAIGREEERLTEQGRGRKRERWEKGEIGEKWREKKRGGSE